MDITTFLVNTAVVQMGGIAPIGELSTHARTFSKHTQDIQLPVNNDLSLVVYGDITLPHDVITIMDKVVTAMLRETSRVSVDDYDEMVLIRKISANIHITKLEVGEMIKHSVHRGVAYLRFEIVRGGGLNDTVMIYYSDAAMRSLYSDVTYEVIPPAPILELEQNYAELMSVVPVDPVSTIVDVTSDNPHTAVWSIDVNVVALDDARKSRDFTFYVVAWGAHTQVDYKIREAIRSFILEATDEDSAWVNYFSPNLWVSNRFWLYPQWEGMAVDDGIDGVYSSTISIPEQISKIADYGEFGAVYIAEHLEIFPVSYKNLLISCIPSPTNVTPNDKVSTILGDYIVSTNNTMFSLQSDSTKQWSLMINDLVAVAEGKYAISDVRTDILRSAHGAVVYFTASTNGVTYSVAQR